MANNDNLKPFNSNQSREEAKKNGRKGGIKSGEAKRRRKTMREMLDYLLSKEITNKNGEKATTLEAVMVATIKKALTGDTRAAEFIRDTIGEKPTDRQEITGALDIQKEYILPAEVEQFKEHYKQAVEG